MPSTTGHYPSDSDLNIDHPWCHNGCIHGTPCGAEIMRFRVRSGCHDHQLMVLSVAIRRPVIAVLGGTLHGTLQGPRRDMPSTTCYHRSSECSDSGHPGCP